MKKILVTAWLFIALIPSLGIADEPADTSVGQFSVIEISPALVELDLTVEKARDEELQEIVGHGLSFFSPWLVETTQRSGNVNSRIKLWDEANRWGGKMLQSRYVGLFQKTTVLVAHNR